MEAEASQDQQEEAVNREEPPAQIWTKHRVEKDRDAGADVEPGAALAARHRHRA
jgi:hypothetical protein